jgi:uncharacterized membrane protein YbhN (UPF0104 family)
MEAGRKSVSDESADTLPSRCRAFVLWSVKAVMAVALLYAVLSMVSVNEMVNSLRSARPLYIIVAVIFLVPNLASRIFKWRFMLRASGNRSSTWEAAASILLGISLGSFTPAQLGELGGRFMRVPNGKSAHILGLTLLDRAQIFLVLAMSGIVSYSFLVFDAILPALLVSITGSLGCLFVFFHLEIIQKLAHYLPLKLFRREWFVDFLQSFGLLTVRHNFTSLLYSVAFNAVLFLQMYFLLNAFSSVDAWKAFLGFSAMMFLKSLLPISIADIGLREMSAVYFFSILQVSSVVALNASLLMFAINMILPSILGLFFLPAARVSSATAPAESRG